MVPRFAYIHKVAGSPPLRYGGIEPTGPLPGVRWSGVAGPFRYGRTFRDTSTFEVVDRIPEMGWTR